MRKLGFERVCNAKQEEISGLYEALVIHEEKLEDMEHRSRGRDSQTIFQFRTVVAQYQMRLDKLCDEAREYKKHYDDTEDKFDQQTMVLQDCLDKLMVEYRYAGGK